MAQCSREIRVMVSRRDSTGAGVGEAGGLDTYAQRRILETESRGRGTLSGSVLGGAPSVFVLELVPRLIEEVELLTGCPLQKCGAAFSIWTQHALELSLLVEVAHEAAEVAVARHEHRSVVLAVVDHGLEHELGVDVAFRLAVAAVGKRFEDERIVVHSIEREGSRGAEPVERGVDGPGEPPRPAEPL